MLGHPKFSATDEGLFAVPVMLGAEADVDALGESPFTGRADRTTVDRTTVDRGTFEQWYEQYVGDVYGYVSRRLGREMAEDVTSETFVQAWRRRERFEASRGVPRAWLFGIATNVIRDHRRSEQRQLTAYARTGVDPLRDDEDLVAALGRADVDLIWPQVAAALAGLGHDERDVVWLHAVGELTYVEIAEALDIPLGTVRSRISRARARLSRVLARHAQMVEDS
jgi:RNA polymerase sigma-70 factor (ECF subfamily)